MRLGRSLPYRRGAPLLSRGEAAFFAVLNPVCRDSYIVFPKVRLADVIAVTGSRRTKGWWAAFNRIASKHVDFVICDPATFSVVGIIELDDKSHYSKTAGKSDQFKDAALAQAGIPLLRISASNSYSKSTLVEAMAKTFKAISV